jgi:hypothetical protein
MCSFFNVKLKSKKAMKKMITTVLIMLMGCAVFSQLKTTRQDRTYWNGFVDYVELKGMKGNANLNRKDLNLTENLFNEYNKINKKSVSYTDFVKLVQSDIQAYREQALTQIRLSRQKHAQNPKYPLMFSGKDEEFMQGLSVIDGFAGMQTTSWKFPKEIVAGLDYIRTNDIYVSNTTEPAIVRAPK